MWLVAIPVTADAQSQLSRFVWVAGQETGIRSVIEARTTQSLNLGLFSSLSPEFVFIQRVTLRYTGGNWQWISTLRLTEGKSASIGVASGQFLSTVAHDESLSGTGTSSDPLVVESSWDDTVINNPTLSRRAYIGEGGHLTGIRTGALSRDAVNLHTVRQDGIFDRPVLSTLATPPGSSNPGDRHIVGVGATSDWANHDNDVVESVPVGLDYTSWSTQTSAADNSWQACAYAPEINTVVAVASNGSTSGVMYSQDGGITWNTATTNTNDWRGVAWSEVNRLFVAVGRTGTGTRVMTSPDGINWDVLSGITDRDWRSVCWGDLTETSGLFVAVSADGYVMTSPDGTAWTDRTAAEANSWIGVCFGNGLFVAVAETGTNRVMTSEDGVTWDARAAAAANSWTGGTWGSEAGLFVAVAYTGTGNRAMYSADGITWSSATTSVDNNWVAVAYSVPLKVFVAIASGGNDNRVMYSTNGTTWTVPTLTAAESESWRGICWCDTCGRFVAVAYTGTGNRVLTSDITTDWIYGTPSEGDKVYDIATMSNCLYQGEAWQREFVWEFTTTTTNAAGSSSDSSESLTPVLLSAGDGLDLSIEVGATLQSGAGTAFKQTRYDFVGYDGELNGTPTTQFDGITGTNGITVLSVDVTAEYDGGSPTGELNITVGHTVVSAAAETVLDWTVKVYGKWKENLGDYC